MRTIPTTYNFTALYSNGALAHYVSLLIYNAAGSSTNDLTNFDGMDLVRQIVLNDSIDDPGVSAKISLQKDCYKKSLAPTNANSKWNQGASLVFVGLRCIVYMASVPIDVLPQSSDFVAVADQHIDEIEFAKDSMECTCSDRIVALLRNTYIDVQRTYPLSGTSPIETVMQGILDDAINTPLGYTTVNGKKITLQLPGGSPGFVLNPTIIQKQTVLDALTNLAGNIGWSLRSKWVTSLSSFALCFYAPTRSVATTLFNFPPTVIDDIAQATIRKTDVRNYIYGTFTDSANNNTRQTRTVQDATSIARYGDPPMKMEITEAATSQINTAAQMDALLGNALSDLKDPGVRYQVTVPLFWAAEPSDVYKLLADDVNFDSDQSVGLLSFSHTVGKNAANTQMNVSGALPGQYNRWFAGEARPGVSPSANTLDPSGPVVLLGANVGQIIVNYTVADQANWQTTEVYISGTVGTLTQASVNSKYQRPTGGTLAAKGKAAHFTINALAPGQTYYVAIVVIDRDGNVGAMSAVQSVATQTVGPYHENIQGQQDQLIRNPDFNIYTLGLSSPPDNWNLDNNVAWASSIADQTNSAAGSLCIYFASAGATPANGNFWNNYVKTPFNTAYGYQNTLSSLIFSNMIPMPANELVNALVYTKGSFNGDLVLGIVTFTLAKAYIATRLIASTVKSASAYNPLALEPVQLDATARFIQVFVMMGGKSGGITGNMYIDRVYANRALAYTAGGVALSSVAANTDTTATDFYTPNNHGVTGTNGSGAHTINYAGTYTASFSWTGNNAAGGTAPTITLSIKVGSTTVGTVQWTGPSTTAAYYNTVVSLPFSANAGDSVTFIVRTTVAASAGSGTYSITQTYRADR